MKIQIHAANDVGNELCIGKFDLTQFQSLDINLQRYRTYRGTDKFIGTNCTSLLTLKILLTSIQTPMYIMETLIVFDMMVTSSKTTIHHIDLVLSATLFAQRL